MRSRGRTRHHVSKISSEDLSRRPTVAMDYYFLKPSSTASSHTIPDESVTCIAVKEDRHQNILSNVVVKKGIEEPWASEKVARFIDSLGHKEITLKSDTEPAEAFRNRVAENCNAEVTLEDSVKGDKTFKRIRRGVISSAMWRAARKKHSDETRRSCRGWWNMRGASCPGRKVETVGRHSKDCMARSIHKSLCHSERRCWRDQYLQNL